MMIQTGIVQTESFSMDYFRFGRGSRTMVILPGLSVQSVMGAAQAVEAASTANSAPIMARLHELKRTRFRAAASKPSSTARRPSAAA